MDRFEKLSVAAFVLALITFIAAGNPHIAEKQNGELHKIEVEAPTGEDVVANGRGVWTPNIIGDVACEGVSHTKSSNFIGVTSYNSSGYCYYTETRTSKKMVFYGLEIVSVPTIRGESL